MKKIYKIILYLTLFLVISPSKVWGLTISTPINSIDKVTNIEENGLKIKNLTYHDYSDISTKAFGITGEIENTTNQDITVLTTAKYYDKNQKAIWNVGNEKSLSNNSTITYQGTSNSDTFALSRYSSKDIYYYSLEIKTIDNVDKNITPSQIDDYKYLEYVIDNYDINIKVNENNTLDIKENITAYFNTLKHGIYRNIPLKNKVIRLDNTEDTIMAKIRNVKVNNKFTTSRDLNNYQIKIGSANKSLTGKQQYEISYTYDLGKDKPKTYDELYYNIIGDEWDTVIGNVTFTIQMPKKFDVSKLGFSKGTYGSTSNDDIEYNVKDNTITGKYNDILKPGEALTVRTELDEGYFIFEGYNINPIIYLSIILSIIFAIISWYFWHKYGKDNQVIETVEFYPPGNFNSLEIAFLYKGKADNYDVVSLLIYLANKGYIQIEEISKKNIFGSSEGFKLTKLKDYDGDNVNERMFFDGLFSKSNRNTVFNIFNPTVENDEKKEYKESVTDSDLQDKFYVTVKSILANTNQSANKYKIFEKSADNKSWIIIVMMLTTYLLISLPALLEYGDYENIVFAVLVPAGGAILIFYVTIKIAEAFKQMGTKKSVIPISILFGIVLSFFFVGPFWTTTVLPALLNNTTYVIPYIWGIICIIIMVVFLKIMPKRTPYGTEMLGKIRGFKRFLETAEKEKLEQMVNENPTYFYDILPYTYVLDISDTWIKKFESIAIEPPSWYYGYDHFDIWVFNSFMNSTMASAQTAMTSSPYSSSDSSGGGFSGGGSGGGGGGSW